MMNVTCVYLIEKDWSNNNSNEKLRENLPRNSQINGRENRQCDDDALSHHYNQITRRFEVIKCRRPSQIAYLLAPYTRTHPERYTGVVTHKIYGKNQSYKELVAYILRIDKRLGV